MFFKHSFFESFFCFLFCTSAFDRDICTDAHVSHIARLNVALAIIGTAKLSGVDTTDSNALRRTLHSHALPSTSAAVFVVIGFVKMDDNFSPFTYLYPFQCG